MPMDENIKRILEEKDKRIYELEVQNRTIGDELAGGFHQTIEILSSLLTFTERMYEGNHARFVSEKSEALAKLLGLKQPLLFQIKIAGMLHALGKVSFQDSNLFKFPHEMTPNEHKQYQLYPVISVEILKNHKAFDTVNKIILQHCEHLDGSGFPNSLRGDDIHPGAKIISVVDTYHNLVYKKHREAQRADKKSATYTNTQALLAASNDRHTSAAKYLESRKGAWYDARVVDAFVLMIEHERSDLNDKQIVRVPVNRIEEGMIFAQDYHTSYGLLIASRGEKVNDKMMKPLIRFAETEEIPHKLLMLA
jgi:response regulator RpfG family c-di-GMP phosphodiesterase